MNLSPTCHTSICWTVTHKLGSYPVYFGENLLQKLPQYIPSNLKEARACIVADRCVAWHYLATVTTALKNNNISVLRPFQFHPGERSKSLATYSRLLNHLLSVGMSRNDFIIALGGGVTGDLAGFAAATYMRGIPFIQLPTSLLAQADSSIGGKTGINLPAGKNLAGAFHFPALVLSDVKTLDTLPERQLLNGLAEIIKIAIISDADLFEFLEAHAANICSGNHREILEIALHRACRLKADIVEKDEREIGVRAWLNLGHTFGHALEKTVGFGKILHGEAVALGLLAATHVSESMGQGDSSLRSRLQQILTAVGLPTRLLNLNTADVLKAMTQDKKKKGTSLRLVIPTSPGAVKIIENPAMEHLQHALLSISTVK